MNMFIGKNSTYGGSTITQQLLKNMTGDDQNTVKRKVTEIFRALEFEKNYSKQEILELYLNTIYLGNGCYGVQTAAQYYFGKDVSQLTVAECASLIGITNNPSVYSPLRNERTRANNKVRQENILKEMLSQGYLDETSYQTALSETLTFTDGSTTADELVAAAEKGSTQSSSQYNSYFVDQVIRDVVSDMEGITKLSLRHVKIAKRAGYRIKLIGRAVRLPGEGRTAYVAPHLIPEEHPLANVEDVYNAIVVRGNATGEVMHKI